MTKQEFIVWIAKYVAQFAPQYGIKVYSPIIGQAIIESNSGQSELSVNANNYFGLKYRAGRCPTSNGIYYKVGSEQNADGSYVSSNMSWMKFPNMAAGVQGYFDFINVKTYQNLKGITDPRTYLETIKKDGYATSIKYVENTMNVINKYNLTQYDNPSCAQQKLQKLSINIHAGHNPDGKVACGAIGLIKESTEARNVKDSVITKLRSLGHTVYDCTVNDGTSQNDVLKKIVSKCNSNKVDLDISIHFNAGANDKSGNGKTTGTEIYTYSSSSLANSYAKNIVDSIAGLGFKNRGLKHSQNLYVLKNTNSPACLIEVCFVDDYDDVKLYNAEKIANAIVSGILGKTIIPQSIQQQNNPASVQQMNIVKGDQNQFSQIIKNIKISLNSDYGLKFAIDNIIDNVLLINLWNVQLSTTSYKKNITYSLQQLLKWWGFDITIDGIYGSGTNAVIRKFQGLSNLSQTGIVDKNTWNKLLGK